MIFRLMALVSGALSIAALANCRQAQEAQFTQHVLRKDNQEYHLFQLENSGKLMVFCGFTANGLEEAEQLLEEFRLAAHSVLLLRKVAASDDPATPIDYEQFMEYAAGLPFTAKSLLAAPACQQARRDFFSAIVLLNPEWDARLLTARVPLLVLHEPARARSSANLKRLQLKNEVIHMIDPALSNPAPRLTLQKSKDIISFIIASSAINWHPLQQAFSCCSQQALMHDCLQIKGWLSSSRADQDFCPFAIKGQAGLLINQPALSAGCVYRREKALLYCKP